MADLPAADWLPFVVTASLLFAVVFGVDAVANTTWADLAGLLSLLAAPVVYAGMRSRRSEERASVDSRDEPTRPVSLGVD